MKNQVKKTLAGLAALAVLVSGASVFAEDTVSQIDTGVTPGMDNNYWAQTFNGMGEYVAPEGMGIYSNITINSDTRKISETIMTADEVAALQAENIYLGGKTGLFGKEDTAFAIEDVNRPLFLQVKSGNNANNNNMGNYSGLNPRRGGNGEFQANFVTFSFEMAVSDYSADRFFQMQTAANGSASNGVFMPTQKILTVAKETGTVSLFGEKMEYTMPLDKWVRFDVVMFCYQVSTKANPVLGSRAYADGILIGENDSFDPIYSDITGKSDRVFKSVHGVHFGFAEGESGCYVDNLVARRVMRTNVPGGEELTDVGQQMQAKLPNIVKGLTLASDAAEIDNAAKTITVPAGTAAGAITGADVVFVTADGTVQATAQENGYAIASGDMVTDDEKTEGTIYYTLTVEGGTVDPDPEEQVTLTTGFDSGYYAEAADAEEKQGVIGFQTRVEKAGAEEIARYGTFLLRSGDFDGTAEQTEIANEADIESGKSFVVEVGNIGAGDFAEIVYAKSFVETVKGNFFYGAVANTTVDAGNKWLGAVSTAE